jgi:predicted PurR-regulated permease PerM
MIQLKDRTRNILLGIGFLFILFLLWRFSAIVTYILTSVVLAFIGKPLVHWLSSIKYKKLRIPKWLAALITLLTIWTVFITFLSFVIPLIINQFNTLSNIDFTKVLDSLEISAAQLFHFLGNDSQVLENRTFLDMATETLGNQIDFSQISDVFGMIASTIGELLIAFFAVSFITFFFLKEKNMFRNAIVLLVPTNYESKVNHIIDSVSYLLRRYFLGLLFEVFMVMLLDTLGLTIVGISFNDAVVIGLICGLFNVIPYLGPWMGAIVGLLIGAALNIEANFMDQTLPLLGFMALVFLSVQIIDNILFQPLIYSSSVKAHPLEIFLVIMAAGSLAGIVGMILAIPVYTILRVIAKEFFDNVKIIRKITEKLENNEI